MSSPLLDSLDASGHASSAFLTDGDDFTTLDASSAAATVEDEFERQMDSLTTRSIMDDDDEYEEAKQQHSIQHPQQRTQQQQQRRTPGPAQPYTYSGRHMLPLPAGIFSGLPPAPALPSGTRLARAAAGIDESLLQQHRAGKEDEEEEKYPIPAAALASEFVLQPWPSSPPASPGLAAAHHLSHRQHPSAARGHQHHQHKDVATSPLAAAFRSQQAAPAPRSASASAAPPPLQPDLLYPSHLTTQRAHQEALWALEEQMQIINRRRLLSANLFELESHLAQEKLAQKLAVQRVQEIEAQEVARREEVRRERLRVMQQLDAQSAAERQRAREAAEQQQQRNQHYDAAAGASLHSTLDPQALSIDHLAATPLRAAPAGSHLEGRSQGAPNFVLISRARSGSSVDGDSPAASPIDAGLKPGDVPERELAEYRRFILSSGGAGRGAGASAVPKPLMTRNNAPMRRLPPPPQQPQHQSQQHEHLQRQQQQQRQKDDRAVAASAAAAAETGSWNPQQSQAFSHAAPSTAARSNAAAFAAPQSVPTSMHRTRPPSAVSPEMCEGLRSTDPFSVVDAVERASTRFQPLRSTPPRSPRMNGKEQAGSKSERRIVLLSEQQPDPESAPQSHRSSVSDAAGAAAPSHRQPEQAAAYTAAVAARLAAEEKAWDERLARKLVSSTLSGLDADALHSSAAAARNTAREAEAARAQVESRRRLAELVERERASIASIVETTRTRADLKSRAAAEANARARAEMAQQKERDEQELRLKAERLAADESAFALARTLRARDTALRLARESSELQASDRLSRFESDAARAAAEESQRQKQALEREHQLRMGEAAERRARWEQEKKRWEASMSSPRAVVAGGVAGIDSANGATGAAAGPIVSPGGGMTAEEAAWEATTRKLGEILSPGSLARLSSPALASANRERGPINNDLRVRSAAGPLASPTAASVSATGASSLTGPASNHAITGAAGLAYLPSFYAQVQSELSSLHSIQSSLDAQSLALLSKKLEAQSARAELAEQTIAAREMLRAEEVARDRARMIAMDPLSPAALLSPSNSSGSAFKGGIYSSMVKLRHDLDSTRRTTEGMHQQQQQQQSSLTLNTDLDSARGAGYSLPSTHRSSAALDSARDRLDAWTEHEKMVAAKAAADIAAKRELLRQLDEEIEAQKAGRSAPRYNFNAIGSSAASLSSGSSRDAQLQQTPRDRDSLSSGRSAISPLSPARTPRLASAATVGGFATTLSNPSLLSPTARAAQSALDSRQYVTRGELASLRTRISLEIEEDEERSMLESDAISMRNRGTTRTAPAAADADPQRSAGTEAKRNPLLEAAEEQDAAVAKQLAEAESRRVAQESAERKAAQQAMHNRELAQQRERHEAQRELALREAQETKAAAAATAPQALPMTPPSKGFSISAASFPSSSTRDSPELGRPEDAEHLSLHQLRASLVAIPSAPRVLDSSAALMSPPPNASVLHDPRAGADGDAADAVSLGEKFQRKIHEEQARRGQRAALAREAAADAAATGTPQKQERKPESKPSISVAAPNGLSAADFGLDSPISAAADASSLSATSPLPVSRPFSSGGDREQPKTSATASAATTPAVAASPAASALSVAPAVSGRPGRSAPSPSLSTSVGYGLHNSLLDSSSDDATLSFKTRSHTGAKTGSGAAGAAGSDSDNEADVSFSEMLDRMPPSRSTPSSDLAASAPSAARVGRAASIKGTAGGGGSGGSVDAAAAPLPFRRNLGSSSGLITASSSTAATGGFGSVGAAPAAAESKPAQGDDDLGPSLFGGGVGSFARPKAGKAAPKRRVISTMLL